MRVSSSVLLSLAAALVAVGPAVEAAHPAAVPLLVWGHGPVVDANTHRIKATAPSSDIAKMQLAHCDATTVIFEQQGHSTSSLLSGNHLEAIKESFQGSSHSLEVSYVTGGKVLSAVMANIRAACPGLPMSKIPLDALPSISLENPSVFVVSLNDADVAANTAAMMSFVAAHPEAGLVYTASKTIDYDYFSQARALSKTESKHLNIRSFFARADTNATVAIINPGTGWYNEFQFFNSAIFEGMLALVFVFAVVYVGISPMASLQTMSKFEKAPK